MFICSEVVVLINKLTNKQTQLKASFRYATMLGKYNMQPCIVCEIWLLSTIQSFSTIKTMATVAASLNKLAT